MPTRTKTDTGKTKVFLVDDHPLVRELLSQLIQRENDMEVCGEAEDAHEAVSKIEQTHPDIVVADISLKTTHGLELVKDLQSRWPSLPVLMLSMHDESLYAERVLRAGAKGYITKQEATKKILFAIRQVLSGQIYVSEKMAPGCCINWCWAATRRPEFTDGAADGPGIGGLPTDWPRAGHAPHRRGTPSGHQDGRILPRPHQGEIEVDRRDAAFAAGHPVGA